MYKIFFVKVVYVYSSVNNIIIIIMVKDTISQIHATTYVNNSKDIFAAQVR